MHVHSFLSLLSVTGELQPGPLLPRTPGRGQGGHDAGHLQTQGHRQLLVTHLLHKNKLPRLVVCWGGEGYVNNLYYYIKKIDSNFWALIPINR